MNSISWSITLFVVHLFALAGVVALYRRAPCWMQKLSVFGLILAMSIASAAYAVALVGRIWPELGLWGAWEIFAIGLLLEHLAVLLMIFRLVYQTVLWPTSLHRSPSSRV